MSWGSAGWLLIAVIIAVAAVLIAPATRAAERYLNSTRELALR